MLMRLFFTQLFVSERKQIAIMAYEKSPTRISHRLLANNSLGNEDNVKNNADAIIFRTAKCAADVTFSPYRRAKSEILLAIPTT